jgi:ATP-dependent Clp protease protease subunit
MAGDEVLISPTGMLMIHNPSTVAMGDHGDLEKAIDMLNEVKNSIINAYQEKTGLSRNKLSKLMEDETWMDANKAVEFGFADGVITRDDPAGIPLGKEDPDKDDPEEDD